MVSISEMKEAIERAEIQIRRANECLPDMVELLVGKLRTSCDADASHLHAQNIAKLKKELSNFNSVTHRWRE